MYSFSEFARRRGIYIPDENSDTKSADGGGTPHIPQSQIDAVLQASRSGGRAMQDRGGEENNSEKNVTKKVTENTAEKTTDEKTAAEKTAAEKTAAEKTAAEKTTAEGSQASVMDAASISAELHRYSQEHFAEYTQRLCEVGATRTDSQVSEGDVASGIKTVGTTRVNVAYNESYDRDGDHGQGRKSTRMRVNRIRAMVNGVVLPGAEHDSVQVSDSEARDAGMRDVVSDIQENLRKLWPRRRSAKRGGDDEQGSGQSSATLSLQLSS